MNRPGNAGQKSHLLEVAGRPDAHLRKCILQIAHKSINHLRAPALCLLALQNVVPNIVTREIELGVMGDYDADGHLVDIEFYRLIGAARTCR